MVSNLSLIFMVITLIFTCVLPVIAVIYFYRKWEISIGAVFAGAAIFIFFQLLTRIPLLGILSTYPWFQDFTKNTFIYSIFLALTAGIFEEMGRFLGFNLMLRKKLEWKNGIAYGIGHGSTEAILLVGLSYIGNIIYSVMINSGMFDTTIAPLVTPDMAKMIKSQLIDTPSYMFMFGGIERLLTMVIHAALSLVVLYGVMNKKFVYVIYAILLHTLLNAPAALLSHVNVWISELYVLIFAAASMVFIIKSYSIDSLKPEANPFKNDITLK